MGEYKDRRAQACMRAYEREHIILPYVFANEVNAVKFKIPLKNRKKFDAEVKDCIQNYRSAYDIGDQYRIKWIRRRWNTRLKILMNPECCNVPPMLIQRDGESQKEWLDRCYREWR